MINPALLEKAKAKGTDAEYQAWVRLWPSCLSGAYSEVVHGIGKCEFAHVRRAGESGTAYKGEYSGLPLTHEEHAMQHQKGESVFCAPAWWDNQASKYLMMWINGMQPPEMEEQGAYWKKEYTIEHAGQMVALWLLMKKHFNRDKAPPVKCTIQRATKRRTTQQNSAQWGVTYDAVLKYYKAHPDHLAIDALKSIGFGFEKEFVHSMLKHLLNGGKSTAGLNTIQSAEYAKEIRHHFLHEYQHDIPEPVSPGIGAYENL